MLAPRMNYADARAWLEGLGEFHMEFGLDRVRAVLATLGNPERFAPSIHVAGTNGKGMTCAFAASMLRHHGVKVGLYTSPHLSRPNERIAISGKPIDDAGFADALTSVRAAIDASATKLTYFEAITCAAFVAFREEAVGAAVIEVGLGGRLDATNVVDPFVSVITHVSLDHTAILGTTIEQIAAEKAGIVKPGRPVVVHSDEPHVHHAVLAQNAGGHMWRCGPTGDVGWETRPEAAPGPGGLHFPGDDDLTPMEMWHLTTPTIVECTAMAAVAVRIFDPSIRAGAVHDGMIDAHWPGRGETLEYTDPLGFLRKVRLDGAHNPAAAARVGDDPLPLLGKGPPVFLFAAMADKDRLGILRELAKYSPGGMVCTSTGTARSATARSLAEEARSVFGDKVPVEAVEPIEDAFERATELVSPLAGIVVTGSLYLVGRVREIVTGGPPTAIG